MSDERQAESALGFLLLRDGHAVPLAGISPEEIKAGARHLVPHPDAEPLKHKQTLTAIVDRLGFRGDFGTYTHEGWPGLQDFLRRNGCTSQAAMFPADHGGCIDLGFWKSSATRRELADRIFESGKELPKRVFLGYGVDWKTWDSSPSVSAPPNEAIPLIGGDPATAVARARALWARRLDLSFHWGFLDDRLIGGPVNHIVDKTYWPPGSDSSERTRNASLSKQRAAVAAFRAIFDASSEGWVDVLPATDRLFVLRAGDGAWDLLWRAYRAEEPPKPADVGRSAELAVDDLPLRLMGESDHRRSLHFRQEFWDEQEAHLAEQAFYDRGGSALERRQASESDVRLAWLRESGRLPAPDRQLGIGEVPPGFRVVHIGTRRIAVSELIELGDFQRMLVETGYLDRRAPRAESWERASAGVADGEPVAATWADAQAFCAWKERKLGVAVRLPTKAELRAMRPFYSEHYSGIAGGDFWWENHPPKPLIEEGRRREVPSALVWSEPRFDEEGSGSRKRWIVDFPPAAASVAELPWAEHSGLRFIDAWDAYEWCQEKGWISGRFWEGEIGATSWGAYKNVKVGFRLVLELGE